MTDAKEQELTEACVEVDLKWDEADRNWDKACLKWIDAKSGEWVEVHRKWIDAKRGEWVEAHRKWVEAKRKLRKYRREQCTAVREGGGTQ